MQDPSPVADNETTEPPQVHTATADVTRSCAIGSVYVPDSPLAVESTTIAECPEEGIMKLDGLRWEIPVGVVPAPGDNQWAANSVDPATQNVVLHEVSGVFDVTLRFRGVVERQNFTISPFNGGTPYAGTDGGFVEVPAIPSGAGLVGNEYYLFTSNPTRIYALSGILVPAFACYAIDYTVTIPLAANTVVGLIALTRDNFSNRNLVSTGGSYAPALISGILNGGTTLPDSTPFPGQFIQMDVVSVTPQ